MADRVDELMNRSSATVQVAESTNQLELVFPDRGVVIEMSEQEFLAVFGQGMRIITGESADVTAPSAGHTDQ